jgi:hypothetical protein
MARVTTFSPDYPAARFCIRQTATSGSCSLPLDQYLPSPRPSGGSLVIIGPGTLPGPMAFVGTRWVWSGRIAGADRRTCESPRRARGAPCCRRSRSGEVDLTAEPLADDRDCGMNSMLLPEPTHPGRYGKFKARRSRALRNPNQRKAALPFISPPAPRSRRWTICDKNSKMRETRQPDTDGLD